MLCNRCIYLQKQNTGWKTSHPVFVLSGYHFVIYRLVKGSLIGFGQSVMFTAVVTGSSGTPTGIVTFFDNGTTQLGTGNLSGGQASYSTSSLSQGSHSITAAYSGDAQYNQSTSSVWTQTVNQTSSSTTITSSANPSNYGSSVTFTATVSPNTATGTVQFSIDGTNYGSPVTLSGGSASSGSTSSLGGGNHTIKAVYSGDTNYAGSTSSGLTQTVSKASSSTTISSSANPSAAGQSVTFTATVSPSGATGTVQFSIDGTNFGTAVTLNSGSAQSGSISTLTVGNHTIKAVYGGDTNDVGSTSSVLSQIVTTVTAAFSPASGPVGTNITVTGSGWALSDTISGVTVGGTTATNTLIVNSSGSLSGTITVPSTLGTGAKIIVITGIQTLAQTFNNAFTVTTVSATFTPISGPVGTSINVTGSGWATAADSNISVTVGGIAATDTLSINSIGAISGRITVPSGVTTKTVIINAAISGTQTFNNAFTLTTAAATFSPTSGPVGTIITVTGSGWPLSDSNYAVTVGGTSATDSLTANSSGALSGTITVPSISTGIQIVSITEAISGIQIFSTNFTVTTATATFNPTSGKVGSTITVTGSGWALSDTISSVKVGGTTAANTLIVNSSGSLSGTITVPSVSVGLQNIIITGNISGTQTFSNAFTVVGVPTVTVISPNYGPTAGGTSVTITGTNFVTGTTVTIGGNAATGINVTSSTTITATTPAGTAGAQNVVVTNAGGSVTSTGGFTYVAPPTVTGISPNSGPSTGGTSVTVTGSNFTGASAVKFGSTNATAYTVISATSITATSPSGSGNVDVTVTTSGGTSATNPPNDQFSYTMVIAQRGIATTAATTNTTLTINKPTGVMSGDILIVNISQIGNSTTAPTSTGWTLVAGANLAGTTARYGAVLYKLAGSSEPASYTFTLGSGTNDAAGAIVAFSGVSTTTPFDVTPGAISVQASQTGVATTSVTTVSANDAVIMFGMAANGNPTWSGWKTATSPGTLTELYDFQSNSDSVGAAWAIKTTTGSTGAGAATLSSSTRNGGILIALRP
jgi:hypothetical protein